MKYIRTKDGRLLNYEELSEISKLSISMDAMEKNCDFEIADTIEELCDCYVIKDRDEHLPFVSNTSFDYSNNKDKNNFDVYGAIWVGVNLKSVAKMDDKGELCLI